MSIAIIGGTGPQGQGLAKRFAQAGFEVIIGSRNEGNAKKIANFFIRKLHKVNSMKIINYITSKCTYY